MGKRLDKIGRMVKEGKFPGVITEGRIFGSGRYFPELARYPGDPEAYVGSKREVRELLAKRGWGAEGMIEREVERLEPSDYVVAEDIVQRHVEKAAIEAGGMSDREKQDLADQLRKRLSGNKEKIDSIEPE